MQRISLKAFVAGNVLAFALLFGLLLGFAIIMLLARPAGMDMQAYQGSLVNNGGAIAAEVALCIVALAAAGYVAARLAGHDLLLNATLAATGVMVINVWDLFRAHGNPFDHPILTLTSWIAPLFTLAGGWLAQRRAR